MTDYHITGPGLRTDQYLRTVISADNKRAYFSWAGMPFFIDTESDQVFYSRIGPGCCYGDNELSLSANQIRVASTGYFYDPVLNAESYLALNLREMMNISYVYGAKLSPNGGLLFQPTTLGIDVLDARYGNLLARIALPIALSPNYDALVSNGIHNVLIAITGTNGDGIAVVDLTSIPEPSPPPYETSAASARRLVTARSAPLTPHRDAPGDASMRFHPGPEKRTIKHATTRKPLDRL